MRPSFGAALLFVEVVEDGGEVFEAVACGFGVGEELSGEVAEREFRGGGLAGVASKAEILEHERGGEAGGIVAVGGRGGEGAGDGAVGGESPTLGGGGGGDVVEGLVGEAEGAGEEEGLAGGDHGDAEDHVVADFCGLAVAGTAAGYDVFAHGEQDGAGPVDGLGGTAEHEGEGGVLGSDHAAGDGSVQGDHAGGVGEGVAWRADSTSMVEESRKRVPGAAAARSVGQESRTMRPEGSMVMTVSASATAACGVAARGMAAAVA